MKGSTMACARCARLREEEAQARKDGDHSAATDCRVLVGRHPHRDDAPSAKKDAHELEPS
ncbi:hypothetical protein [Streptomyces sp. NBC_01789]|uniref:hypothetical protein n=1 Tax=Streptomyces sp. NBC_01789 TaxID=2975941 RepID=UPI00224E50BB|nr:hypothetical protein [Streptomyces sp. NBC_01789]MCX4451719.1 hypothetical protein [Streptomyces sp. NBC_01789]